MRIEDAKRWEEVRGAFDEVIDLTTAEKRKRLAKIATRDSSLSELVQQLIASDAAADSRLSGMESTIGAIVRTSAGMPAGPLPDTMKLANRMIGHFRILSPIAAGGMGVVYSAHDTQLNRPVALKFPLPEFQADGSVKMRFIAEAQSAGALDHPNVCSVYETGESPDGHLFLAMPLYEGETVKSLISRDGALPIPQALAIGRQVADGLACAHAAGIVHRDVKPGNVMVLPNGSVKILDFGLAKVRDLAQTATLARLGTATYMAPEHIRGEKLDGRADLWALGVMLYEMVAARRPFAGDHDLSIARAILEHDPVRPSSLRIDVPHSLESVIFSLLEKDPRDRYASASDVSLDLAAIERGETPRPRKSLARRSVRLLVRSTRRPLVRALFLLTIVSLAALGVARLTRSENDQRNARIPTSNLEAYELYLRGRDLQVRSYSSAGGLAAAESLFKRALTLDPKFALVHARLASLYSQVSGSSADYKPGQREAIRRELDAAIRLEPNLPDAHLAMGYYLQSQQQHEAALAEFELARRGLPHDPEVMTATARSYRALGRWGDAVRNLERALSLDPQNLNTDMELGMTYSRLRRYEDGVRSWDRLIADGPTDYAVWLIRGNTFLRWEGSADTLAAILRRAPQEFGPPGMRTWTEIVAARVQRRHADALAVVNRPRRTTDAVDSFLIYESPVIYSPRSLIRAQIDTDAGFTALAAVNYDSARVLLEARAASSPRDPRMRIALGLAYAGLGRKSEAMDQARRALEIAPVSKDVLNGTAFMGGAAEVFALAGANEEALAILDSLLTMPAGREASVPLLRVDPAYARLRKDPRFERMLARH
jgi:serine/threonine protein kinase